MWSKIAICDDCDKKAVIADQLPYGWLEFESLDLGRIHHYCKECVEFTVRVAKGLPHIPPESRDVAEEVRLLKDKGFTNVAIAQRMALSTTAVHAILNKIKAEEPETTNG